MLHINEAIVVEGIYDKKRLQEITDAVIISVNGFAIYKDKEKISLLKRLAKEKGLIILTDSDFAGKRIRNYIKNCLGDLPVRHAYIPQISGRERRKEKPGAEGVLGVEGMTAEVLEKALRRAGCMPTDSAEKRTEITKAQLYADGLIGAQDSDKRRKELAKKLDLPLNLSTNALLDILNALCTYEEYRKLL